MHAGVVCRHLHAGSLAGAPFLSEWPSVHLRRRFPRRRPLVPIRGARPCARRPRVHNSGLGPNIIRLVRHVFQTMCVRFDREPDVSPPPPPLPKSSPPRLVSRASSTSACARIHRRREARNRRVRINDISGRVNAGELGLAVATSALRMPVVVSRHSGDGLGTRASALRLSSSNRSSAGCEISRIGSMLEPPLRALDWDRMPN